MLKRSTSIWCSLVVVLAALGFTGCLKQGTVTPPKATAYISILHMAPQAPATELYFNGSKVTQVITSGSYSSVYSAIDPTAFEVKFKKEGADSVMATIPAASYDSMHFYTLLLYNVPAGQGSGAAAIRIDDDFSGLTTDKSYYRFFHMSPNSPAADLYIDTLKVSPYRQPADNTNSYGLNIFQAAAPGYHAISVKEAGTTNVLANLTDVNLAAGYAYTFVLKGLKGGTGLTQLSLIVIRAAY